MIRILLSKKLGELKWTQADLARATGIRPTTISDYYNEIAERMNLNHLDLICEALDCSPTEILVREPNLYGNCFPVLADSANIWKARQD